MKPNALLSIFSFPRSGTTWFCKCLDTAAGIRLAEEPFYRRNWFPRLSAFYLRNEAALEAYRTTHAQGAPGPEVAEGLPPLVKDWCADRGNWTGFKEVYSSGRIPLFLQGVRQAGFETVTVYLWRDFPGVAASYEKRNYYWWVTNHWQRTRDTAQGDDAEIVRCFEPEDELGRLFLTWLVCCYRDLGDLPTCAPRATVIRHADLMRSAHGGPWQRVLSRCGAQGHIDLAKWGQVNAGNGARSGQEVKLDERRFEEANRDRLSAMREAALRIAERLQRPADLRKLLGL